jgi:hypothetical protein
MATLLDWGNVDAAAAQIEKTLNLETRREAFSLLCVTSLWTCNGFAPVTYLTMPPLLRMRAG